MQTNVPADTQIDWNSLVMQNKLGNFLVIWIQNQVQQQVLNDTDEEALRVQLRLASTYWHSQQGLTPNKPAEEKLISEMAQQIAAQSARVRYQATSLPTGPGRISLFQEKVKNSALRIHTEYGLSNWDYVVGGLYVYDVGTNFIGMAFLFESSSGDEAGPFLKIVAYVIMGVLAFLVSLMEHAIARAFNTFMWLLTRKNEANEFHMEPGTRFMSLGATLIVMLFGIAIMFWGYSTSASVFPRFMGESDLTRMMGWIVAFFISALQWMHVVTRRYHAANQVHV